VIDPAAGAAPDDFDRLLAEIRACTICAASLPLGPRPVLRGRPTARLVIISQAPGTRVHETGLSFNDRSGDRLRDWLAMDRATFYDEARVAILPVGFCYPGRDPRSGGDLPPRPECAPLWHPRLLPHFSSVQLTLLVGSYAIYQFLPQSRKFPLAATIARWREFLPDYFVLPHPSWRTTAWERKHAWFAGELLPELRAATTSVLV
jgi:uracil-DNA glycosylase